MIYRDEYLSPLGKIILAARDDALIGLWFEGQRHFPSAEFFAQSVPGAGGILSDTAAWLDVYFSGERIGSESLRLAPESSEFAKSVWDILCEIPYGQLTSYGAIAKKLAAQLGRASISAQAVGGAVGRNPISIIIPCHRVIGSDGSLTGYAGGLERKRALLRLEGHSSI